MTQASGDSSISNHGGRRSRLLRGLLAVTLVSMFAGVLAPLPAWGAAPRPMGVYRGPGPWGSSLVPRYETFVGRPVDYVLDFQDVDTWANQTWPDWQADAWRSAGRTVILGTTGVFPGDWNRRHGGEAVGWAQAAAGHYDAHWRRLGERLVATGQAAAILRGAHEFNGGWFPWRVESTEVADFVAAWRRWVDIMRSVPGNRFTFDWNPVVGQQNLANAERAYPGDAWVDRIALDVYDGWYSRGWRPGVDAAPTPAEQDAVWDELVNGPRGLVFWRNFARSRGKPLSFPEWGIRTWAEGDGRVQGGGDNPRFIERMHEIITDPAWNVAYHAFWEKPGSGVIDTDGGRLVAVPRSREAFLRLFGGTPPSQPAGRTATTAGYWMLEQAGVVYGFGRSQPTGAPVVGTSVGLTAAGNGGFWALTADGAVHARSAEGHGSVPRGALRQGERVTGIAGRPQGDGYWVFTDLGRVFAFGAAAHHGDMASVRLNGPVVAAAPTPSGRGYWLVGSDGGIFSFGDARFHGSMGGIRLNEPVISIIADPDGWGYWLVGSDGGTFAFDAAFRGSVPGVLAPSQRLNKPIIGAIAYGDGYLMVASDGGVFAFSNQPFLGSLGASPPRTPVVGLAVGA